jgi:hypothetical protein
MRKGIGDARDFYRLRVIHVDDADAPDLEWRDDILWRRPPASRSAEYEVWRVEAVALDDDTDATPLGAFDSSDDAHEALDGAQEDLDDLTRSEFEERYFPVPSSD